MDIKSFAEDPSKVLVQFEDPSERFIFGENAPFSSAERRKSLAWASQGLWLVSFPSRLYWHRPEEFPKTIKIPYRVAGYVASQLALKASSVNSEVAEIETGMLDTLTAYREQRLADIGAIAIS